MPQRKKTTRGTVRKAVVIGSADFEKISAVEGIRFSPKMQERAAEAKRDKLSAEEYRAAIIRAHRKA